MNKKRGILALVAAGALFWVIAARANTAGVRPSFFAADAARSAARLPPELRMERGFIKSAAASSRFEAEAARLAIDKASDPRLRDHAREVVKDHQGVQPELLHLLHARDMALPMLENEHRRILKRLARAGGRKFDRIYLEEVGLRSPREDIRHYAAAAQVSRDPVLKAWIDRRLPALRDRLAVAERLGTPGAAPGRAAGRAGAASPVPPSADGGNPGVQPVRVSGSRNP